MTTFNHWFYGRFSDDELNLIFSGWFFWNADEAARMVTALNDLAKEELEP